MEQIGYNHMYILSSSQDGGTVECCVESHVTAELLLFNWY